MWGRRADADAVGREKTSDVALNETLVEVTPETAREAVGIDKELP
jgi:hypothetical protein